MAMTKENVRRYWNDRPCGSDHALAEPGSAEFFRQVEDERNRLEPFIPDFAQFERWQGKRVLEVGVGLGTDFIRFVRAGARATGVDLTEASIDLVHRRVELEGLKADLRVADAESLPFADGSFDLVYSWGVLHHTPDTQAAVHEVRRVLDHGGEARIMLYSRRSWVAYGLWLRYALAEARPWRSLSRVVSEHMESEGTKAYTEAELRRLFAGFSEVRTIRFTTPYDRRVAGPLAGITGKRLGWFAGVVGQL